MSYCGYYIQERRGKRKSCHKKAKYEIIFKGFKVPACESCKTRREKEAKIKGEDIKIIKLSGR